MDFFRMQLHTKERHFLDKLNKDSTITLFPYVLSQNKKRTFHKKT